MSEIHGSSINNLNGDVSESRLPPGIVHIGRSLVALAFAFAVGAVVMLIIGRNPIEAYSALITSSVGDKFSFGETLENTTPLIFTGLTLTMGFQARLFNLGAEGQLLMGALTAAYVGVSFSAPAPIHVAVALLAGAIVGGLWSGIAGILLAFRGVHEVISTIMLNFVAFFFINYMVTGPMKEVTELDIPQTARIAKSAMLPRIFLPSRLSAGFIVALFTAVAVWWLVMKTPLGYELRAVGRNPDAARQAGIRPRRITVLVMVLSGSIAGLGGAVIMTGLFQRYQQGLNPGFGFTAIAVALLGRNTIPGVILAAFLFGVLAQGARGMQTIADVPTDTILMIQALVIFFVSTPHLLSLFRRRKAAVAAEAEV
ncbi:MAG: ABC transporter permease [Actinobacteria bacterium]|nr:ABC transporter permease [Actinomycetota bacterium]